jgi:hypothetical protein
MKERSGGFVEGVAFAEIQITLSVRVQNAIANLTKPGT